MSYQETFPIPVEWLCEMDESIAETVARWAEQEVAGGRLEHREEYDPFLLSAIRKLFVDIGCQSMLFPENTGGGGLCTPAALITCVAVLEQVGIADTGIAFLLANTFTLQSTFLTEPHGSEDLASEFAPVFCEGTEPVLCSLVLPGYGDALGEAVHGFSGLPCQVTASRSDGQWALSGYRVRPQCSGATAGLFGFIFEGEGGEPAMGLVSSGSEGLSVGEPFRKTGLAPSINADLDLVDVPVPESRVASAGSDRYREMLSWYYACCSAACLGSMLACYEILKEWCDTRVIKGKGHVFKENPLVASLIGEIGGRTGAARILTWNLARILSRPDLYGPAGGQPVFATATAVFKQVSRSVMLSIDNAMELMASAGYATEWNLERYWRDVKTMETYVVPETVAETDMARHYFGLNEL